MKPPRPVATEGRGSVLRFARSFRRDLLSALPERLYHAWMADFRSPLIRSLLCNDPDLIRLVLKDRPGDFPKSDRLRTGLAPLLGQSVFVTNGDQWAAQRRIIDPAFAGGRLNDSLPAILGAAEALVARLSPGTLDIEPECSHAAADMIFRVLFSTPIESRTASEVHRVFRAHQESQPVVNLAALLPWPRWLPLPHSRRTRRTAARLRHLIAELVDARARAIRDGIAPDDLATRIMTTADPATGLLFSPAEMVDQVAIFFLAGHETSASSLAWALWLLAANPAWQDRVLAESRSMTSDMAGVNALRVTRAVYRETLRLYPPVPMMVRQSARDVTLRGRVVPAGAQIILSPWHLHRHQRLWDRPDDFDPDRWEDPAGRASAREAFIPFSAGPRVCPGAGLAMIEGAVMLAFVVRAFHLEPGPVPPVPIARLSVRGRDGITIRLTRRENRSAPPPPA